MKNILKIVILLVGLSFASCKDLVTYYDFDTNPDGLREKTMLSYFESSYDTTRREYVRAINRAGLSATVEQSNITCVVPSNAAFRTLYTSFGVSSADQMPAGLLRNLLEYLIFPGSYRCLELVDGVNHQVTALNGNPVWIMRQGTADNKYAMIFNDAPDYLSTNPYPIAQQDFLFKNNVVAQVVATFPIYSPKVAPTEDGTLRSDDPRTPQTETLEVTDNVYVYANGKSVKRQDPQGIMLSRTGSGTERRVGFVRVKMVDIPFSDDIVSATFNCRVVATRTGYTTNSPLVINLDGIPNSDWKGKDEATATWDDLFTNPATGTVDTWADLTDKRATKLGTYSFNSLNVGTSTNTYYWVQPYIDTPVRPKFDITPYMVSKYDEFNSTTYSGSGYLSFVLSDISVGNEVSGKAIYLGASNSPEVAVAASPAMTSAAPYRDAMSVILAGPIESNLVMTHNKAVSKNADGIATLLPENSFEFSGPAVSDGYNYAPQNIIYKVKTLPQHGLILKNGLPVIVNGSFTQAEMKAGIVSYVALGSGTDSFQLKVTDYLKGMYVDDNTNESHITVNIQ